MAKPKIGLVVTDMDGTMTGFFDEWHDRTVPAWRDLCDLYGVSEDDFFARIEDTSKQARFTDIEGMIETHPLFQDKALSQAEQARQDEIVLAYKETREAGIAAFDGVYETLQAARDGGSKIVIYTDANWADLSHRMFRMGFPLSLVDHCVCQPNQTEQPPIPLNTAEGRYIAELQAKTEWADRYKPSGDMMRRIMDRFGATPAETVMVGDTVKDGGCAKDSGCIFAFQEDGAKVDQRTVDLAYRVDPYYPLGYDASVKAIQEADVQIDLTLSNGFADLARQVEFVPIQAAPAHSPSAPKAAQSKRAPALA